jgi:hypothetical protein
MPWKPVNEILRGRAYRNVAAYRKAVTEVTQKHVAEMCDVAPPTLSDCSDQIERVCLILAAAGLKVVGYDEQTISRDDKRYWLRQQQRAIEHELAELGDTRPADL